MVSLYYSLLRRAPQSQVADEMVLLGMLALVGNTWRARWKYRHFAEISALRALWIQVVGVVFIREPKLT